MFLTAHSLATILGGTCLGIVFMVIALAPLLRRQPNRAAPKPAAPQLAEFHHPERPSRCARCGGTELVHVPNVVLSSRSTAPPAGPLALGPAPRAVELELLACTSCGHAECYAVSPRVLEAFRGGARGRALPYRF